MSMDGRFIHALAAELDGGLADGRVNKIYQLSRADFLFLLRAGSKNRSLYISLSPQTARVHLTEYDYDKPATPSGFCMLLRKYLESGTIRKIEQLNSDRIIAIRIENNNDFGEKILYTLIVELMGKHANLILLDADGTIIDCYKRVSPFEERQRTFLKGFRYELPEDGKINPDDCVAIRAFLESSSDLNAATIVERIRGLSPLAAEYLLSSAFNRPVPLFAVFETLIQTPVHPVSAIIGNKRKYYWFDLFDMAEKREFTTLSALLDDHFLESGRLDRMNQMSKNICQLVKRELDKQTAKLEKISGELTAAKDASRYRIAADLIIQNLPRLHKGDESLEAESYVDGAKLVIRLDRLLDPRKNAEAYFKKYKKAKLAVAHLEGQIALTLQEIRYFELLTTQLETASLNDLLEIAEELKENHYLKEKPQKSRRPTPSFETFIDPDGIEIVVGKNNVQNEYVTHKLARANEWWFHVKDVPGSHVLVRQTGALGETTIRAAANLAAFHSQSKYSSSVAVDYTLVKHVRKVPGVIGSFVTYANQKTIYIDPDAIAVQAMRQGKKR